MKDTRNIERIGVIILAAGGSRRLGRPKQLVRFRNKSLLQHIIDQSEKLNFATYVLVLGAHAAAIKKSIDPGRFHVVVNKEWEEGIASSIRQGLGFLLETDPEMDHVLFLLADQPMVTSDFIQKLLNTHLEQGKAMTCSKYQDTVGVPAIFSRQLFHELSLLEGDRGAKVLMKKYPDNLATVPFDRGSIDIDDAKDYDQLLRLENKREQNLK